MGTIAYVGFMSFPETRTSAHSSSSHLPQCVPSMPTETGNLLCEGSYYHGRYLRGRDIIYVGQMFNSSTVEEIKARMKATSTNSKPSIIREFLPAISRLVQSFSKRKLVLYGTHRVLH